MRASRFARMTATEQQRVVAVACMHSLVHQFPDGECTRYACADDETREAWERTVTRLRKLQLVSPKSTARDVNVPRLVREARAYLRAMHEVKS